MDQIRIVEVSPRDGLQNEKTPIPTETKLSLIQSLLAAGLTEIEVSSFVSPKWVPQLGDVAELWPLLPPGGLFSALVPNARGFENAQSLGVDRIAVFTAASDAFTQMNINMTVVESLAGFRDIFAQHKGFKRAYVSTVFECPYAGRVEPQMVVNVVEPLLAMGADEISLGDTIGVGTPREVQALHVALQHLPQDKIVWHFHDTRGTAIANVSKAIELGYRSFDSSAGGLGGCPYAKGAGGNLATEDLVYFAHRQGLSTGVDLAVLSQATLLIFELLGRAPSAKAQLAVLAE
ncbi:MAG: hydroxymethylglutaryl-CoA lyase [Armatimonadetes bacterium Cent15-Ar3]|nr:MAG: hydroxymethylglutaryl-CoA lyase [Armatimonadetes bacterium Cent15-Ar3]